jgi:hypothetical protein
VPQFFLPFSPIDWKPNPPIQQQAGGTDNRMLANKKEEESMAGRWLEEPLAWREDGRRKSVAGWRAGGDLLFIIPIRVMIYYIVARRDLKIYRYDSCLPGNH